MKPTVVILAAGENSRFFPLNTTTHKGALTLCGKPLIVRTLENLDKNYFRDVVIVVSQKDYGGKGLSGFLEPYSFNLHLRFVLQPEPKGMGDALMRTREYLGKSFAVVFPTSFDAGDLLTQMIERAGTGGALVVSYTEEPWLYGIVTIEGKRVSSIVEKPEAGMEPSNLMVQGIYYLSSEYLRELEKSVKKEYGFEEALDRFVKNNDVHFIERPTTPPSLKYPWHLFVFQRELFLSLPHYISPHAHVAATAVLDESQGNVYVEQGAHIGHATRLVGPCYIGKDVMIGDFSLIRESSFEEGASVGVHSDVARSIVMEHSSMHNGFLGDSILGREVKIGAGFITSNRRIDRKSIEVQAKEKTVDIGSESFGTVIGDHTKIGIRVGVMPGKLIGAEAFIYPNTTIYENVPHKSVVKVRQSIEIVKTP